METNFDDIEPTHSTLARQQVMADLKALVRDSEQLLKATAGDLTEKGKEARARVTAALQRAKETCESLQVQTAEKAKAAAKKADLAIRDHPYESVGVAFGLGLLMGVLVARKEPRGRE